MLRDTGSDQFSTATGSQRGGILTPSGRDEPAPYQMNSRPCSEPVVTSHFETQRLSFREVEYPESYGMSVHVHESDCIVFVERGTVQEARGKDEFDAPGASLLFVPAGRPHSNRYHRGVRTFDILFSPGYSEEYREFLPRPERSPVWEPGVSTWLATRMRH